MLLGIDSVVINLILHIIAADGWPQNQTLGPTGWIKILKLLFRRNFGQSEVSKKHKISTARVSKAFPQKSKIKIHVQLIA